MEQLQTALAESEEVRVMEIKKAQEEVDRIVRDVRVAIEEKRIMA